MANIEELASPAPEKEPNLLIVVRSQGVEYTFDRETHYYTQDGNRLTVRKHAKGAIVAQFCGTYALTIEEEVETEDSPGGEQN